MKKLYFYFLMVAASSGAFAQNMQMRQNKSRLTPTSPAERLPGKSADKAVNQIRPTAPSSVNAPAATNIIALPPVTFGEVIGNTAFDLQAFCSGSTRVVKGLDNGVAVIWTYGRKGSIGNGGLGYNRFQGDSLKYDLRFRQGDSLNCYPEYFTTSPIPRTPDNFDGTPGGIGEFGNPGIYFNTTLGREAIIGDGWARQRGVSGYIFRQAVSFLSDSVQANIWTNYGGTGRRQTLGYSTFSTVSGNSLYSFSNTFNTLTDTARANDTMNAPVGGRIIREAMAFEAAPSFSRTVGGTTNWDKQYLPYLNAQEGITGMREGVVAMDSRGSTVAVVMVVYRRGPIKGSGAELVMFKSNANGAPGSWGYRVIDAVYDTDTNNTAPNTTQAGFQIADFYDGSVSIVLDNNNKVHFVGASGIVLYNRNGYAHDYYYPNGGIAAASSNIKYWNEDFATSKTPEVVARPVDVDRDGIVELLSATAAGGVGAFPQSACSHVNISVDTDNHLYLTYSAGVENTQTNFGVDRQTRDIYVAYSVNSGYSWSNPLNLAPLTLAPQGAQGRQFYDDGSSGSATTDEFYPSAVKRIDDDKKLYISWLSDSKPGLVQGGTSGTAFGEPAYDPTVAANRTNWNLNNVMFYAYSTDLIKKQFIGATFPKEVCAGNNFVVPITLPRDYDAASNIFEIQLQRYDTAGTPNFRTGRFPVISGGFVRGATASQVVGYLPFDIAPGTYRARIIASSARNFSAELVDRYPDGIYYPRPDAVISSEVNIDVNGGAPVAAPAIDLISGTSLCIGGTATAVMSGALLNDANEIDFVLSNDTAGMLFQRGTSVNFIANKNFSGTVRIQARTRNACGYSPWVESAEITVGGPRLRFNATNLTLEVTGGGTGGTYEWYLNPDDNDLDDVIDVPPTATTITIDRDSIGLYEVRRNGCTARFVFADGESLPAGSPILSTNPAGAIELPLSQIVSLFPNPSKGSSKVVLEGFETVAKVNVFNQVGQQVITTETTFNGLSQEATLNTRNLAKGMYVVRITSNNQTIAKKLIVE
jgi:hypothetical protein